jgi:hypothetical protein
LKDIIHEEFPEESLILLSLPSSHDNISSEYLDVVYLILKDISNWTQWSLYVFQRGDTHEISSEQANKYHVGVLFAWENEENDLREIILGQLDILISSTSWNLRSKFIVVVTAYVNSPPHSAALHVSTVMWQKSRIVNLIILIMDPAGNVMTKKGVETYVLNVYTWFPYNGRQCAELVEVVLVDQCLPENGGQLSNNEPLFPNKIPNNLLGCTIKVATFHFPPYIIQTENYTEVSGNNVTNSEAWSSCLLLLSEALNSTLVFSQPSPNAYVFQRISWCIQNMIDGFVDVAIGRIPGTLLGVIFADVTVPYIFDALKWYVPCSKPALRWNKLMDMFTPSVWYSMTVVILTSFVFWGTSNSLARSVQESHCYRTVQYSAYNIWSAFMGVSVPQFPRTSKLRLLFLLYMCYCFAMNTVFQALFTSFLVSPGYVKQITSCEELEHSHLIHGRDISPEEVMSGINYKKLKIKEFVCSNHTVCLTRLFTKGDITTMTLKTDAEYVLSHEVKRLSGCKVLCSVNENVFTVNTVMSLTRGHPLFEKFDVIIRRCMETGLVEKYWVRYEVQSL